MEGLMILIDAAVLLRALFVAVASWCLQTLKGGQVEERE